MDKLAIVKQESKTDVLPTSAMEPLPDSHPPTKCTWPIERGNRKGEPCGEKAFDGNPHCTVHQILASRREPKENKEAKTTNITTSCSEIPLIAVAHTPAEDMDILAKIREVNTRAPEHLSISHQQEVFLADLISIVKNFSLAIVNLTEIAKK